MIPGIDFLVVELSEIEIVLKSLEDCVCFSGKSWIRHCTYISINVMYLGPSPLILVHNRVFP